MMTMMMQMMRSSSSSGSRSGDAGMGGDDFGRCPWPRLPRIMMMMMTRPSRRNNAPMTTPNGALGTGSSRHNSATRPRLLLLRTLFLVLFAHSSGANARLFTAAEGANLDRSDSAEEQRQQQMTNSGYCNQSGNGDVIDDAAVQQPEQLHLIVLVHGWMGNANELAYLQQALQTLAAEVGADTTSQQQHTSSTSTAAQTATSNHSSNNHHNKNNTAQVVVHSAVSNQDRTYDGIAAGGTRLADEVNAWIDDLLLPWTRTPTATASTNRSGNAFHQPPPPRVSLSFVGNSLGGLYARYALSKIEWTRAVPAAMDDTATAAGATSTTTTATTIPIVPAVFCTTATPHLGVGGSHTYLPVGAYGERGIVAALRMGQTGRDLFRFSHAIQSMTVQPQFTTPLSRFRHRIALANAFNTDLQVPCSTAAFLSQVPSSTSSSKSTSQHRRRTDIELHYPPHAITNDNSNTNAVVGIAMAVSTEAELDDSCPNENETDHDATEQLSSDELALQLDRLGWIKLFCDVRGSLLSVPVPLTTPSWLHNPLPSSTSTSIDNKEMEGAGEERFSSRELWGMFATFFPSSNSIAKLSWASLLHIPMGHTVLVANSKNQFYSRLNAAGQPIMDALARHLIAEIVGRHPTRVRQQ
jgi:Putative serine esterase (DUF676)